MKSVIFDFNGTLFYDTELHVIAWKKFIKQLTNHDVSDQEFQEKIFGRDNIQVIRTYLPNLDQATLEKYSEDKEVIYRQMCEENPEITHLTLGATSFFDYLKEQNIPFTIATGANKGNVDYYFDKFNLAKWFDYDNVVLDDGYIKGKPHPDVYLLALKKINASAKDCVVFEDSPSGVIAAKEAGIGKIICIRKDGKFPLEVDGVIHDFTNASNLI